MNDRTYRFKAFSMWHQSQRGVQVSSGVRLPVQHTVCTMWHVLIVAVGTIDLTSHTCSWALGAECCSHWENVYITKETCIRILILSSVAMGLERNSQKEQVVNKWASKISPGLTEGPGVLCGGPSRLWAADPTWSGFVTFSTTGLLCNAKGILHELCYDILFNVDWYKNSFSLKM